jgi:hypothetical protein
VDPEASITTFEQLITYSPVLVTCVAIAAIVESVKRLLLWRWPEMKGDGMAFVLQASSVGLGLLVGLVPHWLPGETLIARLLIGIGVGAFSEYGYRFVKKRLVRLAKGHSHDPTPGV